MHAITWWIPGNPFAEGGPSKYERLIPSQWLHFQIYFLSSKIKYFWCTVGRSSPLYSKFCAHFILFFNRSAKVIN
jgi:hypothetical protein